MVERRLSAFTLFDQAFQFLEGGSNLFAVLVNSLNHESPAPVQLRINHSMNLLRP